MPEVDVRRRFDRSLRNFLLYYRALSHAWTLFDNAGPNPEIVAWEENGELRIIRLEAYNLLLERHGKRH